VGSGNLTFCGWSSNLECIDHLHPDGHANGLIAVADFLLDLATSPRCLHAAQNVCEGFSERLRTLNASATDTRASLSPMQLVLSVGHQFSSTNRHTGAESSSMISDRLGRSMAALTIAPRRPAEWSKRNS
jgi:hypothetical protein